MPESFSESLLFHVHAIECRREKRKRAETQRKPADKQKPEAQPQLESSSIFTNQFVPRNPGGVEAVWDANGNLHASDWRCVEVLGFDHDEFALVGPFVVNIGDDPTIVFTFRVGPGNKYTSPPQSVLARARAGRSVPFHNRIS